MTRTLVGQFAQAVRRSGSLVATEPDRKRANGPREDREFGPALKKALDGILVKGGAAQEVALRQRLELGHFSRPKSEIDFVVYSEAGQVELVAELKCWDIGHQLFDLAKVCCLLSSGIPNGLLTCAAKKSVDFDRAAGGELFPADEGEVREHSFLDLFSAHPAEWRKHVGKGTPEATEVPAAVTTTAVATGVGLDAYPGHEVRAVEVRIVDPAPINLLNGAPAGSG